MNRSFNAGEGLRAEIEVRAADTGEMLKAAFQRARGSLSGGTERREESAPSSTTTGSTMSSAMNDARSLRMVNDFVADHRPGCPRCYIRFERQPFCGGKSADLEQLRHPEQKSTQAMLSDEQRRAALDLRRSRTRRCVR
ncbi:hypothetical protein [Pantoea stewartii]|uniref:hypothetical protein n=1 Tax=Pantoea stewartii TaxID=66269 RepID=UPI0025A1B78E|nr:hypothetical protein [Pantoea stewartii]